LEFLFACRVAEVPRSECRAFTVGGREVLICEYGGQFFAHSSLCTHQAYPLDYASVVSGSIACTWHGWCYDVVTGENVVPGRICPTGDPELSKEIAPLLTFAVERRGDELYVAVK
jgi:nitrite reductase/ring-hydroxylating ferredoxin subunit